MMPCRFPRFLWLAFLLLAGEAWADTKRPEIDTEHIFGFTEGTDIGEKGEREFENTLTGRLGKAGRYLAIENESAFRYGVTESFRASLAVTTTYHAIRDVPDLDNRNAAGFGGLSGEFRWRLLERGNAPFGLAVSVAPQWRRIDDVSGDPVQSFALPITVLADLAVIPEKLFAALNVTYTPSVARENGVWQQEHPIEISLAAAHAFGENLFVGAEVRYLARNQDGLFTGHALFVGPSLFVKISETIALKAAWSAQIPDEGRLDLVNFERHQVRALFVKTF
jgi:hypothetical protein